MQDTQCRSDFPASESSPAGEDTSEDTDDWGMRLAAARVSKACLNSLVLDFLILEGHMEAAETFMRESGAATNVDVSTVGERMSIRSAAEAGRIDEAIDRANALDPQIMAGGSELRFHIMRQQFVELIRGDSTEEALTLAQEHLAPAAERNPSLLEELERTMALLAYEEPSTCPESELLSQTARTKTAEMLNAAIAVSQQQDHQAKLPMMLRAMQWAQDELQQTHRVTFPRIDNLLDAMPKLVTRQEAGDYSA